jgi:hypothetical protein
MREQARCRSAQATDADEAIPALSRSATHSEVLTKGRHELVLSPIRPIDLR